MNAIAIDRSALDDTRRLRSALGRFATGVTIITTRSPEGKAEGLTVNSFGSLSLDPPMVLWSLRRGAPCQPSFARSGYFAVNVLAEEQGHLSRHFATPAPNKFADVEHSSGFGGCPILPGNLAQFECRTDQQIEAGDHVIFIGRVERFHFRDGDPLIFSAGRYCRPTALAGLN